MRTKYDYLDSIGRLKAEVYAYGSRVTGLYDHPCFRPAMDAIGLTYELAREPGNAERFTADSPFTGERVNRFLHIHQSREDLLRRLRLGRFMVRRHGACIGARCVATTALNALHAVSYDMDCELGTGYHDRVRDFIRHVQENDLAVSGAMMDVRGDRRLAPHQQADPDLYLRVVERRSDGIVVRGAKASISGAAISNEIVVFPCTRLGAEDADYAVSFAVPSDAPGVIHVAEAPAPNMRRLVGREMDFGNARYGVHGSTHVIFQDVFVPWDRVFMCGEHPFAAPLVDAFATLQRLYSTGCKTGHRDLLMGAAATVAEYNGVEAARHIRGKLADLFLESEKSFGCALAAVFTGQQAPSGVFVPDALYANIAKLQGVEAIWQGNCITSDIAGGLVCTLPAADDLGHEKIGPLLEKYFKGKADVSTENRIRIMRLVEYLTGQGSVVPIESTHGGGSPEAQRMVIQQALLQRLEGFKEDAKAMAGIQ